MALIAEVLFPPPDARRTTVSLLMWWEARRPLFNGVVGAAGLLSMLVVRLISWLPPGVPFVFDWKPVVAYGLLANLCYSFGFGLEAVAQRLWGDKCPPFGPALFRQGLVFSVGLTFLPILLVSLTWLARVLGLSMG